MSLAMVAAAVAAAQPSEPSHYERATLIGLYRLDVDHWLLALRGQLTARDRQAAARQLFMANRDLQGALLRSHANEDRSVDRWLACTIEEVMAMPSQEGDPPPLLDCEPTATWGAVGNRPRIVILAGQPYPSTDVVKWLELDDTRGGR